MESAKKVFDKTGTVTQSVFEVTEVQHATRTLGIFRTTTKKGVQHERKDI